MFDHIVFSASNYEESKSFFLAALKPLGVEVLLEGPLGIEMSTDGKSSLCIRREPEPLGHLHIAFVAQTRDQVDAFYYAALEAGAKDNGAPAVRPEYSSGYYAAFVLGPDGHNIEMVCHEESA